ncbi:hypothetical protein JCGZ_12788 [Jatropha curcas]|uniref:Stigma-specific STIG1-like protein 1 n=1 Tax=Jatropha curcas TaxID=180498 RepID=A0A067KRD7_JATCU|nr:stigma-specific STIG1-like protein 1 [Jatropha curcas]KDP34394.1 hypothetical protein JCGZ_12788 [Jatropha curcas]
MRSVKFFILLAVLLAFTAIALSSEEESYIDESSDIPRPSMRGIANRFLGQRRITCDKYPRVCHGNGSPGPDCCKKKCVNVMTDKVNCGKCGKKCKFPEICCKGACVNLMSNKNHCGGCNNKCKKGRVCAYGMCSYA